MSAHLTEKEEKIKEILERLVQESAKGTLVVVEGKKDVRALRDLGVEGKIVPVKSSGKPLLDVISELEQTGTNKVILMLDFDRRGKELTAKMRRHLEGTGIVPDTTFWGQIFGLAGRDIKDVEGLAAYMETLERKYQRNSF